MCRDILTLLRGMSIWILVNSRHLERLLENVSFCASRKKERKKESHNHLKAVRINTMLHTCVRSLEIVRAARGARCSEFRD